MLLRCKAGRLVSGPYGLTKAYSQVLEKVGYRCARCNAFGIVIDKDGKFQRSSLTIDHIHEKADGGSSRPENLQVLCSQCHRMKTWLSAGLRTRVQIDEGRADVVNRRFIGSYDDMIGKKALRNEILKGLEASTP